MLTQATVEMILDSVSPQGKRITTMKLRYWRAIHAETLTHRAFSRNASSSRAIPVAKVIEQVRKDPAGPLYWGTNKPGMQAGPELIDEALKDAENLWRISAQTAANVAEGFVNNLNLHKQVANRVLEPYQFITVLVTATEWENFFKLRIHPAAQPEIKDLAEKMKAAMDASVPTPLASGEWHLPYSHDLDADLATKLKVSAARCARVSYNNFDGDLSRLDEDITLHDRLVLATPPHASPAEHQARPATLWGDEGKQRNFVGWCQYRAFVENGEFPPEGVKVW